MLDTKGSGEFPGWQYSLSTVIYQCQEGNSSVKMMEVSHLELSQTSPDVSLPLVGM